MLIFALILLKAINQNYILSRKILILQNNYKTKQSTKRATLLNIQILYFRCFVNQKFSIIQSAK